MHKSGLYLLLSAVVILFVSRAQAQERSSDQLQINPDKLFASLSEKSSSIDQKLDKNTSKYLNKLKRQEAKLKKKIWRRDTLLARQLFEGVEEKYAVLRRAEEKLGKYNGLYSGHLDSLTTALSFFKESNLSTLELQKALSQFSSLQDKFNQTEVIRKYLYERKQLLKENLERLGMAGELKRFQKQVYYYSAQVRQYKEMWEEPSKLENKLMEVLIENDKFKEFFNKNSQLASLFALPGSNISTASLQGLQTRAGVQQNIRERFGSGPEVQQMLQQNLQAAQGQLNELKNKLSGYSSSYGNSTGEIDMPEGFRPNRQKTKTFLQRLEYGTNIQNQKARNYFPGTSDVGLSLGYKFNDNSSMGIGASYKLGWGRGWNHLRLTHEGIGLRSYVDYKVKGSLYISGGYEQNHRTAFRSIQQLKDLSTWQSSGLVGLSKKYKVSKKLKGEMKLLWDFLSYQQIPRTQAMLFRIGYNLK